MNYKTMYIYPCMHQIPWSNIYSHPLQLTSQSPTQPSITIHIPQNKEPISDGAPIIYTDRKDGVKPEYDIRTDRFELAVEAMNGLHKTHLAKREERHFPKEEKKDGEAESIPGTGEGQAAA